MSCLWSKAIPVLKSVHVSPPKPSGRPPVVQPHHRKSAHEDGPGLSCLFSWALDGPFHCGPTFFSSENCTASLIIAPPFSLPSTTPPFF